MLLLLSGVTFLGQFASMVIITIVTPHIREQLFEKYRTEKVHQIRRRITVLGLGMVAVVGGGVLRIWTSSGFQHRDDY